MIQTVVDNVFGFGDKTYIQKEGVAIGSRLGKTLLVLICANGMKRCCTRISPYFYKRFIDDGFGIWTGGEEELKQFVKHANRTAYILIYR